MFQVTIDFVPQTSGGHQIRMSAPAGLPPGELHKALCILLQSLGDKVFQGQEQPLIAVPQSVVPIRNGI